MPETPTPEISEKPQRFSFRKWADAYTAHHQEGYASVLNKKPGWFSALLFRFFFRNIDTGPELKKMTQGLPEDAILLYVTPRRSNLEFLFSFFRYQKLGMPAPRIGLDYRVFAFQPLRRTLRIFFAHILYFLRHFRLPDPYANGFYQNRLLEGHTGFFSLSSKKGFERRFLQSRTDPIAYLIEMQKTCERPIHILPQILFYGIDPHRDTPSFMDILFGSAEEPGKIRRFFTLIRKNTRKVFVEFSEPFSLQDFLLKPEHQFLSTENQALQVRRELQKIFTLHRQSITGPVLKKRAELIESILTSEKVQRILEEEVAESGKSLHSVRKKAKDYLDEIAANYSMGWIRLYDMVLTWMLKNIFEGISVDQEGLNRVKQAAKKGPLILVPCHKSHLDYLILSYLFHHNKMPCPHVAAGKNLSFWPLGVIFRGGGAFFLRRTFKGDRLYARIFSSYVEKILSEGFNIEFFIEGGRSRTGKLLSPKMGLLSQTLNAYGKGVSPDLSIVPISIGYDRVLEEKSYLHELSGGEKKPESMGQLVKARKSLKVRYGKVYVNFDKPISLNRYFDEKNIQAADMDRETHQEVCTELAFRCIHAINQVSVATPYGVVAGALLNIFQPTIPYSRLAEVMEAYLSYLNRMGVRMADTLQINPDYALRQVADAFVQRGFVDAGSQEGAEELRIVLNEGKRPILDYYKNNVIAFFIPAAYTSLAILEQDALQFTSADLHLTYAELTDFFSDEFFKDPHRSAETLVRKNLKAFIDDAILVPHPTLPDTYNVTAAGLRKLKLFSAFLLTYLESYWVVLNFFMRYPAGTVEPKNRLKKIQSMGQRMSKRGEINRIESLSGVNYKNGLAYFLRVGLEGSEDKEAIAGHADRIQHYINLIVT
ncbi:1-acyl-sn-glycerol-3-phosphate acyltransferase [Desulfobotulus sp.]|jgi:glycerol-3-phosphate O-acyltransferase|uniref:1-acyl-sn-glycerol-3-phosphate acyltransferase n=1 Tax=Desulfobotulus sp. TaxID=1940337 RepID=UPI002A36A77E|nr:1-acyl-sn-glycerol-3-phosphate acyltransferase [Desulfobotulus sp.]MDY0161882.1 1-acyl-sn-glycerol-3-phosphate acyltransferase [Desulfobotulus sp.]